MRPVRPARPARSAVTALACTAFLGLLLAGPPREVRAETHLFAFGSGATIQTQREEDDLLDPREITDWEGGWQAGVGLRIQSENVSMIGGKPKWETRIRLGYMQGGLADVRYHFARTREPIYEWTSVEQTDVTGLNLGATVHARLQPSLGVFLGPSLERISLKADYRRDWNGTVPDYYNGTIYGGDRVADAKGSAIYGSIELGARVDPSISPVAFELYWIPRRVRMSTTQTVDEDQYKADFATLDSTWGLRATYDF